MRVALHGTGASILNGDDFTSFDFVSDLGAADLGAVMAELGLGAPDPDGAHAWFSVAGLTALAGSLADEQWQSRLQGMADYAASRGWTDRQGRIRAHHAESA
jgi:hypothetical protein